MCSTGSHRLRWAAHPRSRGEHINPPNL